ncbi:MAG: HEAT repeat domain-containing protein [Ardenticatenaceae bacterium]
MSDKLPEILAKLQNADPHVRESALDEIGTLKPANALEIIVPFLSDENAEVRETAACNLAEIEDEHAIGYLIQSARQDSARKVRFYALNALSAYHRDDILDCLVDQVSRGDLSIMGKQTVAEQLGHYGRSQDESQKAVDALVTWLQDDDPYVLVPTVDALLKLNRPCLRDTWQDILLNYHHSHLGEVALQALAELEEVEPIEIALSFVDSNKATVRQGAAHALACIDDERIIPHLIKLASQDPVEAVRDMAILGLTEYSSPEIDRYYLHAISPHTTVAHNQPLSPFARELIAEELSLDESEASVDALTMLFSDQVVHTTAKESLRHLNGTKLEPVWALNGSDKSNITEKTVTKLEPTHLGALP